MDIGAPELLIILAVVFLLFGARKLPDLAKALGQAKREFQNGEGSPGERSLSRSRCPRRCRWPHRWFRCRPWWSIPNASPDVHPLSGARRAFGSCVTRPAADRAGWVMSHSHSIRPGARGSLLPSANISTTRIVLLDWGHG